MKHSVAGVQTQRRLQAVSNPGCSTEGRSGPWAACWAALGTRNPHSWDPMQLWAAAATRPKAAVCKLYGIIFVHSSGFCWHPEPRAHRGCNYCLQNVETNTEVLYPFLQTKVVLRVPPQMPLKIFQIQADFPLGGIIFGGEEMCISSLKLKLSRKHKCDL